MFYLRLIRVFTITSVLAELQYRANFGIQLLQTLITFATTAAGLAIIFQNTKELGGWKPAEMVMLLGVFYLMQGMIAVVLQPSMQRFMDDVRLGTLDYVLTKPTDSQFMVSVRQVVAWRLTDVVLGCILIGAAGYQVRAGIGPTQVAAFFVALLAGAVIVYSFWMMLATMTFWVIKVDNLLVIFTSLYQAGKYPVGIYPPWLRAILTFLVPVAFATTIPAEALTARLTVLGMAGALALAAALFTVARLFWLFGVRSYTGASA